jgi:uncharacterized membrane protein
MNPMSAETHRTDETLSRTITKTVSYRVFILVLDFLSIYLFTGKVRVAVGFMLVSNLYTTLGYFVHERIWDRIHWGRRILPRVATADAPSP